MPELSPAAHDELSGTLLRMPGWAHLVLLMGGGLLASDWEIIHQGPLTLCYGVGYLHIPSDTLLPQWAYDDFRREYHGQDALSFILRQGDAFPRADVVGRRVSTGARDQRFFKEMDIAARLRAIAYRSLDEPTAFGQVDAVVWTEASAQGVLRLPKSDDRLNDWMRQSVDCYLTNTDDIKQLHELPAP